MVRGVLGEICLSIYLSIFLSISICLSMIVHGIYIYLLATVILTNM